MKSDDSHRRNQLREKVITSFLNAPYPGDDNLTIHECDECQDLKNSLRGQNWKEWTTEPLALLRKNDAYQNVLLTPAAVRYFYPLYLLAMLDDFLGADVFRHAGLTTLISPKNSALGSKVLGHEPAANTDAEKRREFDYESLINSFSEEEILVIKEVLEFLKVQHAAAKFAVTDIDSALDSINTVRGEKK
jgi:hypothetical protein